LRVILDNPKVDACRHGVLIVVLPEKFEQGRGRGGGIDDQGGGRMRLEVAEQGFLG
jgi:hypothetical protein